MAYTLRQGLKFVYGLIGQTGATASVGYDDQFMFLANSALNIIYNYQGYIRSWQHTKDLFITRSPNNTYRKLKTSLPIKKIDRFYSMNWTEKEKGMTACDMECDMEDPEFLCPCDTKCDLYGCVDLKLRRILPSNKLCPGDYQVYGGNYKTEFGGEAGSIVQAITKQPLEALRVTYFYDVVHMKSYDDIIPLPDKFLTARAYMVAGHIVPLYGIMMQQQDLNYMSLARKELDSLRMSDNMGNDLVVYDDKAHPFTTKINFS